MRDRARAHRLLTGIALAGVLGVLLGVAPVAPASAAGRPDVEVTITNASGAPIDVVPSTGGFEYQVRASYTCIGDNDCTNMTVSIDAPPLDPYYGTHRKESGGTWTPPFSPAPAATGSWDKGWTVHLGTVRSGDIGTIVFSYFIKPPVGTPGSQHTNPLGWGNFFPPGFPIEPEVTVTADGAAPVTGTDHATYQSIVPTPGLAVSVQAKVKTDTELPVAVSAVSNCWHRNGYNTFKAQYDKLCSDSASITVKLPAKAEYVAGSGGTYDAGAHEVTLTAGPDAWRGMESASFRMSFPSADYPTSGAGCLVPETLHASGTVTYLNGEVKTTSPADYSRAVTVDNCQPFTKGTFSKSTPRNSYQIPNSAPITGHYWDVNVYHQGNVPAVATVTDTTLDNAGMPVHKVTTSAPATIDVTLDDDSTDSVTGTTYDAPTGRRIVSATVVSDRLAGVNSDAAGNLYTRFRVLFEFTVQPGATPGVRTNTATATLTYPDNPELGTFTPTGSPDEHTVQLYDVVPFAKASLAKTSNAATYVIPSTTTPTYGHWRADACNGSNVQGVATVTDDSLDLPGIPVYQIRTSRPATITYTLDNNDTNTVTGTTFTAPTGRRIVSATVVSSPLAGANTVPTGNGCTYFSVYYDFVVEQGATPGDRVNTATAEMEYPNTDLGTITAAGSPADKSLNLYSPATPYTINASALTWSNTTNAGFPPRAGDEVPWKANGQFCNLGTDKTITPQYVFLAPKGWNILPGDAVSVVGVPGANVTRESVTYSGVTHDAVIVTWPTPVAGVGTTAGSNCVNLGQVTVRTTPTLSAQVGPQTGRFFVGDAVGVPAEMYSGSVSEEAITSDIDADGNTTDRFASTTASATLTGVPRLVPVKEICQPDQTQPDGCEWLSDPAVTVGVPPDATSIKYRVTINNTGQTDLGNVVVYDVLPYPNDVGTSDASATTPRGSTVKEELSDITADSSTGMTLDYSTSTNPPRPEVYTGATTGDWTAAPSGASAIRATIPTLDAGTSRTFTYEAALVGAAADQTACNSLAVSADTLVDSEPPRVCATTQEADFAIDVTDRLPLQAGRVGAVPFVVTNGGGSQSATATVTIQVPAEVEVVDLAPEGWQCTAPSTTGPVDVSCAPVAEDGTARSLEKDVPEALELRIRPTEDAPGQLCFDAAVDGLMSDPDPDNDTARSCSSALSAKPELFVSKDDGQTSVAVGEEFSYTITATNGLVAEPVDGVTLTDTLPQSLELVSADPVPTSQAGRTLTWELGRLGQAAVPGDGSGDQASGGVGSSRSVTVTVRVQPGTQDSVTNRAEASGADPADPSVTLNAEDSDTDVVANVFTDRGASETTEQNTPVTTPLADIASTTGAPLDPSLVTQAEAPQHGSLAINPTTGAVTYSPAPGYSGPDPYQVQVCDTTSPTPQCFVAAVHVQVGANVVDAVDDTASTDAVEPVTTDVRANDTTRSGQALADPTIVTQPTLGTVGVDPDGTVTFTPDDHKSGLDSYAYQVCDTSHPDPVCDTATVRIEVVNVFTAGPAAEGNLGVETPHNAPVTTPLVDIVSTSGAPADPATVGEVTAPTHGTMAIDAGSGAVTYTPDPGYAGPDSYTVSVCDTSTPDAQCDEVTVAVTVLENTVSAPDLTAETRIDTPTEAIDVLSESESASGQELDRPSITTEPEHGAVVVSPDGTLVYSPEHGYHGADSFTYQVCDTSTPSPVCDTGTITVTVAPVADLHTEKTVQTALVVAGRPIAYDVALTNQGPSTAQDVHSVDPIPAEVLDPVGTPDASIAGGTCETRPTVAADLDGLDPAYGPYSLESHPHVVECTYPELPAGTTVHDTITGRVDPALVAGSELVNQAFTFSTTYDPALADNLSTATAETGAQADLAVTKVAEDTKVAEGDTVSFTVTVVNHGPSEATGVEVADTPADMRALAHEPSTGSIAGGLWKIGRLGVGQEVTLTSDYEITGRDASNSATADSDISDPVAADNHARVLLRVSPAPVDDDTDDGNADLEDGADGDRVDEADEDDRVDDAAGGVLPDTGSPFGTGMVALALALLTAGALLLARRRRSEP